MSKRLKTILSCIIFAVLLVLALRACNVRPGDEAEIFGPRVDLNVLARTAQTIPYELLCVVSKRVPRIMKDF